MCRINIKKIMFLLCFFYICLICFSQENVFEIKMFPYLKSGPNEIHYSSFKYYFTDKLLTTIEIENHKLDPVGITKVSIKRTNKEIHVFDSENKEIMLCKIIDANNIVIEWIAPKGTVITTYVTLKNDIVYCTSKNLNDTFLIIKKDDPLIFNFIKNGKPYENWQLFDYKITNKNDAKFEAVTRDTYYKKISDSVFEDSSIEEPSPNLRFVIVKKATDYKFDLVDILIDYYCGTIMRWPIIWAQLVTNSNKKALLSALV